MAIIINDMTLKKRPAKKDVLVIEDAPRGHGRFCLRITPTGNRIFYFRYTATGSKQRWIVIGSHDATGKAGLTLKDARQQADEYSRLYQSGIVDLIEYFEEQEKIKAAEAALELARIEAERRAAELEASRLTVQGLFDKWEQSARIASRKDSGKENRRLFAKDVFPAIGHLQAHMVRKGHIMEVTDRLTSRGANRTAKIVFAALRQMFRFALARDFVDSDPTATISKMEQFGKDTERERVLTDDEIKLLAKQIPLARMTPMATAAIWIALSTGCRIGELLKARWEHIDFTNRKWLIPADNSKNGSPLEIYLSDFALLWFRTLEQHRHNEWIYPARNKAMGDSHTSTKSITKQIGDRQSPNQKKHRTSYTGTLTLPGGLWTPHDLRRTASTIMGDLGIKPEVIDRCQNHKEQNRVRRTYQRYSYQSEMKTAWELLGARLEALVSDDEVVKVIPFNKKTA